MFRADAGGSPKVLAAKAFNTNCRYLSIDDHDIECVKK
jgi:hypothetical protein